MGADGCGVGVKRVWNVCGRGVERCGLGVDWVRIGCGMGRGLERCGLCAEGVCKGVECVWKGSGKE
jgi:hypothetical protein